MAVLLLDPIDDSGVEVLRHRGHEVYRAWDAEAAYEPESVRALVVRSSRVDRELLDLYPNLEVVGKHGVGVDAIDVPRLRRLGIRLTFAPDGMTNAVAEHAVAMLLAAARRLVSGDHAVRTGDRGYRERHRLLDLGGRRLGLIGVGRVGARVGQIVRDGLDMSLGGFDPALDDSRAERLECRRFRDPVTLAQWADALVVSVPRTPQTLELVGATCIAALGSEGILVAVGRGGVVDEQAVADAVNSGALWGAGFDVFSTEPPTLANPLLASDRIVTTPHMAGVTQRSMELTGRDVCRHVADLLEGGTAPQPPDGETDPGQRL